MLLFSTTLLFNLLYVTKGVNATTVLVPKVVLNAYGDLTHVAV